MRTWVPVLLGQTKVNDIDLRTTSADTHQEVVRFDISVNETSCVDVLNSTDELVSQEQHGFVGKLTVAVVEQILKRRSQKINYHGVIVTFGTVPSNKRDTYSTAQGFVNFCFVF